MPGNPFKKCAPRMSMSASAKKPKIGSKAKVNGVKNPKQPMAGGKPGKAPMFGSMRSTSKAKRPMGKAKPGNAGAYPGSKPGQPGSKPGAKPW
jgi:hypothetical protein